MRISFLAFLIALSFNCFGQNWNLINANYEYHYALNGEYNTTIKVDSFEVNGSDTTFFLNRIVSSCDSCISAGSDEYLRCNQPTFLQRQVLKQVDDFTFNDTSSFLIKPKENLNASWVFDAINNITAEVVSVNEDVVFGISDSVKTILLSTNDTLKISKNNGFFSFKNYILFGIKKFNQKLGLILPDFYDFYNFNVGDVFQYEDYNASFSNDFELLETYKYTIVAKNISFNYYKYVINKRNKTENLFYNSTPVYAETIDTIIYVNNSLNLANSFNNELVNTTYSSQNYFSKAQFGFSNDNLKIKYFGNKFSGPLWSSFYTKILNAEDLLFNSTITADRYYEEITEGLGLTLIEYNQFEAWGHTKLVGYIKNGVQTGEVWEDWRFTGIQELEKVDDLLTIFPNPAKKTLKLALRKDKENIDIQISNLLGEVLLNLNSKKQSVLDLDISSFSNGIYFIKIETEKSYGIQKFVKQ